MPSPTDFSSQPLLNDYDRPTEEQQTQTSRFTFYYKFCRERIQEFLSSRAQHFTVLGLVSFDLLGIFADIIINLYQCDEGDTDPLWDDVRNALGIAGLVFSCLFMAELLLSTSCNS